MKLKSADYLSRDNTAGFVTITDKGNAQQATFDVKRLQCLGEMLKILEKIGFDNITLTLEDDHPLIIGSKTVGIALAGVLIKDDS